MEWFTSGKLHSYFADLNEEAIVMQERLIQQMAAQQGVTEQLKFKDQMTWFRKMNNIRESANKIVSSELIYS